MRACVCPGRCGPGQHQLPVQTPGTPGAVPRARARDVIHRAVHGARFPHMRRAFAHSGNYALVAGTIAARNLRPGHPIARALNTEGNLQKMDLERCPRRRREGPSQRRGLMERANGTDALFLTCGHGSGDLVTRGAIMVIGVVFRLCNSFPFWGCAKNTWIRP